MDYFQEFVPKQLAVRAELRYMEVKSAEQTLLTAEKRKKGVIKVCDLTC